MKLQLQLQLLITINFNRLLLVNIASKVIQHADGMSGLKSYGWINQSLSPTRWMWIVKNSRGRVILSKGSLFTSLSFKVRESDPESESESLAKWRQQQMRNKLTASNDYLNYSHMYLHSFPHPFALHLWGRYYCVLSTGDCVCHGAASRPRRGLK